MKHYYGLELTYGMAQDETGERIGKVYRFPGRQSRDNWLRGGEPVRTNPGHRIAISGRDREAKRQRREGTMIDC
jgi:hypothetical protein